MINSGSFNSLTTNVPHHIETSQLTCFANQLTGFCMMGNIGRQWAKRLLWRNLLYKNELPQFINPFHVTGLFLYILKTPENFWFSIIFRGYGKKPVAWNGSKVIRRNCVSRLPATHFRHIACRYVWLVIPDGVS